jgi:prevent-host-death family protein
MIRPTQCATMTHMTRIGIRELRQHASRYVERVRGGETIEITLRGLVVARLVPPEGDGWSQLLRAGNVRRASASILDVEPAAVSASASDELERLRDDTR